MNTPHQKTCEYKGRRYLLAWQGQTQFGQRAKLKFMDGSKEFWVAADLIKVRATKSYGFRSRRRRGFSCSVCRDQHDGGICMACGEED